MIINLEHCLIKLTTSSNGKRTMTFYIEKENLSKKREIKAQIKKQMEFVPSIKHGNYAFKIDSIENYYGKPTYETDEVVVLNKKAKFDGKVIKTFGKLDSFEEVISADKAWYIYKLVFVIPSLKTRFVATKFSKKPWDVNKTFKKNTYYMLTGQYAKDNYSTNFLKSELKYAGLVVYSLELKKDFYPEYDFQDSYIKPQERGRHVLHAHTIYSKNDAFIKLDSLKEAFKKNLVKSFAITDHRESRGFLDAKYAFSGTDFKVIPGLEAEVFDDTIEGFDLSKDLNICPRYHMVLLIKSKDTTIQYKGKDVKVNEGFRALNKLITDANLKYYSEPTKEFKNSQEADGEFKSSAKPLMSLTSILEFQKQGLLGVGSACIAGTIRRYWFQQDMENFKKYFDMVDWVEIHPLHNEVFTIKSKIFPLINSIEDIKSMNLKLVEYCRTNNKPFVFGDDAHVLTKEDRETRAYFKMGEIAKFSSLIKEANKKTQSYESREKLIDEFYEEHAIEGQPFLHSATELKEELSNQGFSDELIEEFLLNEEKIAEEMVTIQDITLVPKVMITPGFPGVDLKKVIPEIAWEFAIKKWSKDGTIESIDQFIVDRLNLELKAIDSKDYEVLYYFSRFLVQKSLEKGYIVGSRGSVGSSILAHCMGISENNPLPPHYICNSCKEIEWKPGKNLGYDFEDKVCPHCGGEMVGEGLNIEFSSFLGFNHDKVPDIDLNFSSVDLDSPISIQAQVSDDIRKVFPDTLTSVRSGTFSQAKEDGLITNTLIKMPRFVEHIQNEEFDIFSIANEMTGVYTNSGQHPGGILVWDEAFDVQYCFAFNWVGEYGKKECITNSVDYHSIEEFLPKLDILGKKDPALLKYLMDKAGNRNFIINNMKYNDPKVYEAMLDISTIMGDNAKNLCTYVKSKKIFVPYKAGTVGIPELNTPFTRGVIEACQPQNFTDYLRLEGLTHGTMVWELAKPLIEEGLKLEEIPWCTRDEMFYFFTQIYGADPTKSFKSIEFIRKGKWSKAPDELKEYLKSVLPFWVYDNVTKIKYLFPSAHAASYFKIAYRMMWFKVYDRGNAFATFLNGAVDGVSSFDYENAINMKTKNQYEFFIENYIPKGIREEARKKQENLANVIFEAIQFGFELKTANINSQPNLFSYDEETNSINLPLTTFDGISGDAPIIRRILDSVKLSEVSLERLLKIKVDAFTKEGKPVKKGLTKIHVKALKLEELYREKGYKLREGTLFDLF